MSAWRNLRAWLAVRNPSRPSLTVDISIAVRFTELAKMTPEQRASVFEGVAKVLAAADAVRHLDLSAPPSDQRRQQ